MYGRVFLMVHFAFFGSSTETPIPPPLICSTCLTFLINYFLSYSPRVFLYLNSEKNASNNTPAPPPPPPPHPPWWSSFVIWLTFIHMYSYKKRKSNSSSLYFLSPRLSYAMCIYLTFIAQHYNNLYPS